MRAPDVCPRVIGTQGTEMHTNQCIRCERIHLHPKP